MKKTVLPLLALYLCSLTLMAAPISQQQARQIASQFLRGKSVSFTATNKPASVADPKAAIGTEPVASGDAVEYNSLVTVTAAEAPNYHVEWYVNGKKADAVGYSYTQTMSNDYQIEVRYIENFKFIFEGTPFVKYADANGVIYMGPNFYCHKFDKLRAFG